MRCFLICLGMIAGFVGFSGPSARAAALAGGVEIGPFLNCLVSNPTNYWIYVRGVQYDFVCADGVTGIPFRYSRFEVCGRGCRLPVWGWRKFSGPSTLNCNVVEASCYAVF